MAALGGGATLVIFGAGAVVTRAGGKAGARLAIFRLWPDGRFSVSFGAEIREAELDDMPFMPGMRRVIAPSEPLSYFMPGIFSWRL